MKLITWHNLPQAYAYAAFFGALAYAYMCGVDSPIYIGALVGVCWVSVSLPSLAMLAMIEEIKQERYDMLRQRLKAKMAALMALMSHEGRKK